jgi:hypothetical protein
MTPENKTAAVAGTTTTEKSNYQEAQTTDTTAPRYYRHKTVRVINGVRHSLCGHSRPKEQGDRIIAELGDAWHSTPKCPNCAMLHHLDGQFTTRRQRAERIADFVMDYLLGKEGTR